MAVKWQWFTDVIQGAQYSNEGGSVSVHRQLLNGESVQRILAMGTFQNYFSYAQTAGGPTLFVPYAYWWHLEVSVDYTDKDVDLILDKWGVVSMVWGTAGDTASNSGVYEWWTIPGAMDFDITVRKRMSGKTTALGVTATLAIEKETPNSANFALPDGNWIGSFFMRTLRTAPA